MAAKRFTTGYYIKQPDFLECQLVGQNMTRNQIKKPQPPRTAKLDQGITLARKNSYTGH